MSIKTLLKSDEIKKNGRSLAIDYSKLDPSLIQEKKEVEDQAKIVVEEAEKKAKSIIEQAEKKVRTMLDNATNEASLIKKNETEFLENEKKKNEEEVSNIRRMAEEDIKKLREEFEREKENEARKLEDLKVEIKREITESIWNTTKEEAEKETRETYERLIAQIHTILNEIINQRNNTLVDAQNEIAELVMLIARKVVKVFAERDNDVVIKNIVEAMSKLKGREKFVIRINTKQLAFVKEHVESIKGLLEKDASVLVLEDMNVDEGGCIVESEFGDVDARILTQLAEIEKRIRDSGLVTHVSV